MGKAYGLYEGALVFVGVAVIVHFVYSAVTSVGPLTLASNLTMGAIKIVAVLAIGGLVFAAMLIGGRGMDSVFRRRRRQ